MDNKKENYDYLTVEKAKAIFNSAKESNLEIIKEMDSFFIDCLKNKETEISIDTTFLKNKIKSDEHLEEIIDHYLGMGFYVNTRWMGGNSFDVKLSIIFS